MREILAVIGVYAVSVVAMIIISIVRAKCLKRPFKDERKQNMDNDE